MFFCQVHNSPLFAANNCHTKKVYTSEEDSNFGKADGAIVAADLVLNDNISERVGGLVKAHGCSFQAWQWIRVLNVAVLLKHRSCHRWIIVGQTDYESCHAPLCYNESPNIRCRFVIQQLHQQSSQSYSEAKFQKS